MSQVADRGFGPKGSPYMIIRQPPIHSYMTEGDTRFFDVDADLLNFFQSFSPDIQGHGLWITAGLAELLTQKDRDRLTGLVQAARRQKVLVYVCMAADYGGRSGLVGWECKQRSPSDVAATLHCVPRDQPHRGHPWWDCDGTVKEPVATVPEVKRIEWTEDVRLSDSRTIVVKRVEEYRKVVDVGAGLKEGWLLEQSDISAELPQPIGRRISWRGSLHPVVLDVQAEGAVYLVGLPPNGRAMSEWRLPRHQLYVVLQLKGENWERISVEQLPESMQPNLFVSSYELFIRRGAPSRGHVDQKKKGDLDSNPQIDRRYRTIVRLPAPSRAKETPK